MSRRRGGAPEMPEGDDRDDGVDEAGADPAGAEAGAVRESVAVTVDGDLPSILPALREAGLRIESTLTAISVVLGTVDAAGRRALEEIHGVHVEVERTIQLPPPDQPQ